MVTLTTIPSARPSTAPTAMAAPMLMCASVCSVHEHGDSGRSAADAGPLAFNASFAAPAARFDYPDIPRRPTDEILERYRRRHGTRGWFRARGLEAHPNAHADHLHRWSLWLIRTRVALLA